MKRHWNLSLVSVDQILLSDKFKQSDEGCKYFIGYKRGKIVKPLCIILPEMNDIKYFENDSKSMSFLLEMTKYKQNINKFDVWLKINWVLKFIANLFSKKNT